MDAVFLQCKNAIKRTQSWSKKDVSYEYYISFLFFKHLTVYNYNSFLFFFNFSIIARKWPDVSMFIDTNPKLVHFVNKQFPTLQFYLFKTSKLDQIRFTKNPWEVIENSTLIWMWVNTITHAMCDWKRYITMHAHEKQ